MRHLIFLLTCCSLSVYAQDFSFYLSGKGLLNGSLILNNSITTGENQDYAFAMSGAGGLGGLFLYNEKIGASVDFLLGNHKATYTGSTSLDNQTFSSSINLKTLQIPLLFRFDTEVDNKGASYLEIGPQFNVITAADYASNSIVETNADVSEYYKKISVSGVLGFGSYYTLGRKSPIMLTLGLRINYGLSDIKGVNPLGIPSEISTSNEKSILLAASINLGLVYHLKY